jgi:hypothetical protein
MTEPILKTGIPYPRKTPKYPWDTMDVGQCFEYYGSLSSAHRNCAYHTLTRKNIVTGKGSKKGKVFQSGLEDGKPHVWRTK